MRTGVQTDRQTDKNDEANSGFSQFCERAYKVLRYTFRLMHVPT